MDWQSTRKGFKQYLVLEKSLSANSISAYLHDVAYFESFLLSSGESIGPLAVEYRHLLSFVELLTQTGIAASSQGRMISGLRAFYKYLLMEDMIVKDPTQFLE